MVHNIFYNSLIFNKIYREIDIFKRIIFNQVTSPTHKL